MEAAVETASRRSSTQFAFSDARYTVQVTMDNKVTTPLSRKCVQTKERELISGVTAEINSGHVLAILGPSGAGKTTLLNMLTLIKKGGAPVADIRLNGKPFTLDEYRKHAGYVEQEDSLWATLTAREHLVYALTLYQGATKKETVNEILSAVGLLEHADVRAGNALLRGLSSGLKRRLSIALALAKRPSLLFLDGEPLLCSEPRRAPTPPLPTFLARLHLRP